MSAAGGEIRTLALTEAQLGLVGTGRPAALWSFDRDERIAFAAGRGSASLGVTAADILGVTIDELLDRGLVEPDLADCSRRALAGESVGCRATVCGQDADVRLEPLRGEDGAVTGCVGVAVTDLPLPHRLVHDLRNMLTAIRGYGQMLSEGVDGDERLRSHADHLGIATERAVALAEELEAIRGSDGAPR